MSKRRILVVEDELAIQTLIAFHIRQAGWDVDCVGSAEEAEQLIQHTTPDLVVLDWMLPSQSGVDWLKHLRATGRTSVPVLMLSARGEIDDKEQGLNEGADDYLCKPFSPRELIARLNALLRRVPETESCLKIGALCMDSLQQKVLINGQVLACSTGEFKLLHFFMSHPERVFTRQQLLDWVWGETALIEERTIDVQIGRLRRLLEPFGLAGHLQTVRGSGYRFTRQLESKA